MFSDRYYYYRLRRKFCTYRPQAVTLNTIEKWINQFDRSDRPHLYKLLNSVVYVTETETRERLVDQNKILIERLKQSGLSHEKVVYIQIDEAGSSSPVMLNLLKEGGLLERKGFHFLDSKDTLELNSLTNKLAEGAIIYVDDFVGTGNQFCKSRDFSSKYIVGNFSEFLLSACICEEAYYALGKRGVESVSAHLHYKAERPLHENNTTFDPIARQRLIEICNQIDPTGGLGYKKLATNVIFYRNTPNTVPLVIRGSLGQEPYAGLLPRTTDLPT